jgi:serine/threonine protein kinase
VLEAIDDSTGEIIAVKETARSRAPKNKSIAALQKEMSMLKLLSHQNIIEYRGVQTAADCSVRAWEPCGGIVARCFHTWLSLSHLLVCLIVAPTCLFDFFSIFVYRMSSCFISFCLAYTNPTFISYGKQPDAQDDDREDTLLFLMEYCPNGSISGANTRNSNLIV